MTNSVNNKFAARIFRANAALILIFVMVMVLAVTDAPSAAAESFMFNRADFATGVGPQALAVGDFRGIGMMDVVVGNTLSTANTISVLLGNGNGTFATHVDYAAGGAPTSVAVGDCNGDGKLDIAVLHGPSNAHVSVLLGNGDGTFRPFRRRRAVVSREV